MALTASRNLRQRAIGNKVIGYGTILTAVKVYKGALLARTAAGKITVCANAATLNFAGIAEEECATGDGLEIARFAYWHEVLISAAASVTVGLVHDTRICAVDDADVTTATTLGPPVGRLVGMEPTLSGYAWIHVGAAPLTTQT
jgi:hypothetical protein